MFTRRTNKINSDKESIAALEEVSIGKWKQFLLMRSTNVENPIMLFLHGGPGTAQIGLAPKFQRDLEKEFIVVNWDQRGAGLSYTPELKEEDLTLENMIDDTIEVITYLLNRFNQPKLILVGHSWGSVLGVLVSKKVPELISAYIGIGQVVHMKEGEKISYEFTKKKAIESNNKKAMRELSECEYNPADLKYLDVQRKWLTKLGGSYIGINDYQLIYSNMLFAKEYTFVNWMRYIKAGHFSLRSLWSELIEINFLDTIHNLEIPVFFISGDSDYQTPFELVERYYQTIKTPKKEFILFENTAHLVPFEEPQRFYEECIRIKQQIYIEV